MVADRVGSRIKTRHWVQKTIPDRSCRLRDRVLKKCCVHKMKSLLSMPDKLHVSINLGKATVIGKHTSGLAYHSRMVVSLDNDMINLPSGENATDQTES